MLHFFKDLKKIWYKNTNLQLHYQSDYMQNLIAEKYYGWLLLSRL